MSILDDIPLDAWSDFYEPEEDEGDPLYRLGDELRIGVVCWAGRSKLTGRRRYGVRIDGQEDLEWFDEDDLRCWTIGRKK